MGNHLDAMKSLAKGDFKGVGAAGQNQVDLIRGKTADEEAAKQKKQRLLSNAQASYNAKL